MSSKHPPEVIELIRSMYETHGAVDIAKALGPGWTRSMVIGVASRADIKLSEAEVTRRKSAAGGINFTLGRGASRVGKARDGKSPAAYPSSPRRTQPSLAPSSSRTPRVVKKISPPRCMFCRWEGCEAGAERGYYCHPHAKVMYV